MTVAQQQTPYRPSAVDPDYMDYLTEHVNKGEFVPIDMRGPNSGILHRIATERSRKWRGWTMQVDEPAGVAWVGREPRRGN